MGKRKLILRNFLSPGDLVMLTAAVRDLHRCYPGRFLTDVRTSCPELWENNPHLTPLLETDRRVEQIDCHYPLIDRSNETPFHCIHGFADFLSSRLRLSIRPTLFRGDIHLSGEERRWKSTVHELAGRDLPFWIVNAGGKFDFTIKWWDWRRYQRVIDYFRGRILFVQVGEIGHYHPPLQHVIDLRGRTDLRQLLRLVYHAQGVLCGVTALMHLAAAVPTRPDRTRARAAVIVAGGREPTHWEAYPHHQFIHTIGALPCCATGGCWRARTLPIGDGEKSDRPENICSDVIGRLPHCMDMITAGEVIRRIESYFAGRANRYLTAAEHRAAERAMTKSLKGPRLETTINLATFPKAFARAAASARRACAPPMNGRGILLFATNPDEAAEVLACAHVIRALGSTLPIECWAPAPVASRVPAAFRPLAVSMFEASSSKIDPAASRTSAEVRSYTLAHSNLREILVLEPGTFPVIKPELLFAGASYKQFGARFGRRQRMARPGVWKLSQLRLPGHSADASAFVMDRQRCWKALPLWRWIVDRTYFFHGYLDGDGGAAQLAFAKLGLKIALSSRWAENFWSGSRVTRPPGIVRREIHAAQRLFA